MNQHLSSQFNADLDGLRAQLTSMGGLIEEQLNGALQALTTRDPALIEKVIEGDKPIDALEVAIDNACAHVIAKRQPTAVDLRLVMAIIKAVKDLERIGDEAKKIAKAARKISARVTGAELTHEVDFRGLGEQVIPRVHETLDAFVRTDPVAATRIIVRDTEIDQAFRAAMRQLVTIMMEDPRTISTALDLVFVAKSLERIGDHCKNIAEGVVYVAKGDDVRHRKASEAEE